MRLERRCSAFCTVSLGNMLQLDSHRRLKYIKEREGIVLCFHMRRYKNTTKQIFVFYKYIVSNIDKVQYMTIRELAKAIHISTSTILRFVIKIILRDTLILKKP